MSLGVIIAIFSLSGSGYQQMGWLSDIYLKKSKCTDNPPVKCANKILTTEYNPPKNWLPYTHQIHKYTLALRRRIPAPSSVLTSAISVSVAKVHASTSEPYERGARIWGEHLIHTAVVTEKETSEFVRVRAVGILHQGCYCLFPGYILLLL